MKDDDIAKREGEIKRSHQAQQILGNPLWVESWEEITRNLLAHMEDMTFGPEETYEAKRQLAAVRTVRKRLETLIETGKLAAMQLEVETARRKRHGRAAASG